VVGRSRQGEDFGELSRAAPAEPPFRQPETSEGGSPYREDIDKGRDGLRAVPLIIYPFINREMNGTAQRPSSRRISS
jgi:hypothetical protein